ncbi:MAG: hypothetical protein ABWY04_15345 [Arthrobacter sp.]
MTQSVDTVHTQLLPPKTSPQTAVPRIDRVRHFGALERFFLREKSDRSFNLVLHAIGAVSRPRP